ncbi:hypothetical protein [Arthrobacter zhaoguopingii]|uniref:hypothetical protein n=1 Tax=Arthrobacter zhaoguopingii TaxID=2681491 RepID=UPI001358F076|nr:hypothetical protein [Arthrobacter zhaoguopingii]
MIFFTPKHHSPDQHRAGEPSDRDLDIDVDVLFDAGTVDPDAELAAERQLNRLQEPIFRTPKPGQHLDAKALEDDLK